MANNHSIVRFGYYEERDQATYLSTSFTHVWLLARVDARVHRQGRALDELFPATRPIAGVRSDPGMDSLWGCSQSTELVSMEKQLILTMSCQVAASSKTLAARCAVKRLRRGFCPSLGSATIRNLRATCERAGAVRILQKSSTRVCLRGIAHVLMDVWHLVHGSVRWVREDLMITSFGEAGLRLHLGRRGLHIMILHELLLIKLMGFCGDHSGRTFSV